MELFAQRITYESDHSEELTYLFFEMEKGGFTISRRRADKKIYLEINDPVNGQWLDPDCLEYVLDDMRFHMNIVRNNRRVLEYLEERQVNTKLYGEITIRYAALSKQEREKLTQVVHRLFFGDLF